MTEYDWVWLSMTEDDWAWLSMTKHDWAWLSMTEHDWALLTIDDWWLTHLCPLQEPKLKGWVSKYGVCVFQGDQLAVAVNPRVEWSYNNILLF